MRWLAILLLLSGCATGHRWYWKPAAEIGGGATRDVALWSLPETEADMVFECGEGELHIVFVGLAEEDLEDPQPRPVTVRAGGAAFRGVEVVDPLDDGYGSSVIAVPLDHPLVAAIGRGARSIRFQWPEDRSRLPLGRIPSRFVRACAAPQGSG
jgi:hypothetical protein